MNNKKDPTPYKHRGQWYDTPAADRMPKNHRERTSRHRAAIHEAGHILVGFKQGFGNAWGRIDPAYIDDLEGKPFFMSCWTGAMTEAFNVNRLPFPPGEMENWIGRNIPGCRTFLARREIGIAGAIAECLSARNEKFRDPDFWNDDGDNAMSETDWQSAGFDPDDEGWAVDDPVFMKSVHAVGDFLKANFSKVRAIARQLVAESRDPPDLHTCPYIHFYRFENFGDPDKYARFLQRNTNHSDPETGVTKL